MPITTFNSVTPDPIKTYIFIPYDSPLLDSEALYCEFWIFYFKIKRHTCIYKNIRKKVFVSPDFTGALCDIAIQACKSLPCKNGANCVDQPTGRYMYIPGFAGIYEI